MRILRKTLIASAVALAVAGPAQAASVLFDVNGGGDGPGADRITITTFDGQPGNLLLHDITPIAIAALAPTAPIYAQSVLGTLAGPGVLFSYNGIPGQLTYQLTLNVNYTAGPGTTTIINPTAVPGIFDIFFNPTAIANDITGCGYGDSTGAGAANAAATLAHCGVFPGTRIYRGTALLVEPATLTDNGPITPSAGPPPVSNSLDQFGDPTQDEGIITNALGLGTLRINVDTLSADTTFFLSDISSLPTDIRHTEQGGGAPFEQANPSDESVGQQISRPVGDPTGLPLRIATYGGDLINNTGAGSCGGITTVPPSLNTSPCDVHLQSDASSTVLTSIVPEPQSLALLGLGLGLLGASLRRRVKRFVA